MSGMFVYMSSVESARMMHASEQRGFSYQNTFDTPWLLHLNIKFIKRISNLYVNNIYPRRNVKL